MKIFKIIFTPFIALFKGLYFVLDKILITPLSKIIYNLRDIFKNNSGKIEKILNMPNVLFFFSLICAFGLVLLVDSQVITLNNSEAEILTDQPVKVTYNEESYVVEGVPEKVDITLIGSKSALYLANHASNNQVSLDLSGYGVGTYKVKLKYNTASTSISYKLDPSTVTVKISSKLSEERNLGYDLLNEQSLDQRLSISKVELNTSSVVVKSSKEILDKVSVVKALVDVKDLGVTTSGEYQIEGVKLVAYDSNGDKVNNVEIVPSSVVATVTLDSYSATKPVKVITTGKMQSGYAIDSITSSVANVTVYGSQSVVDSLDYIEAQVNVNGLEKDVSNKADLIVPTGIRYMSSTTTQVSIKVGSEDQITLTKLPVKIENLGSDYTALAVNEDSQAIDVMVKGTSNVIKSITAEDIRVYVDLSGLSPGVNKVTVQVSSSDTRVTVQPVTTEVEIKINKK
jgi:YbbR domain-containing protein